MIVPNDIVKKIVTYGTFFAHFVRYCEILIKGRWRMKESKLERKLQELVEEFGGPMGPKSTKLAELAKQARDDREKLQKSVDRMQESLDYLRVCIKYQIFDLEATRRENKYLRQLLEDSKD